MGVTMFEAANMAEDRGEFARAGVMKTFARAAPFLNALPRLTVPGSAFSWTREVSLGTNAFRKVNGSYTASEGQSEPRMVPIKIMGGDLDVDKFILRTHGAEIRAQKEEAKAADLAQRLAYNFIKGSVTAVSGATADPDGFDGLQVRYGGGFGSTAVLDAGENASQILANSGASDALSMRDLDIAIQAVQDPTHLLMTKKQRLNITGFLRSSSSITQTKDEFGRLVTAYNGLPIMDADVLGTVSGLEQLGYNENNDSTTSIYVLSLLEDMLTIVQNGDPDVADLGEQDAKPVFRTRVEWYGNLADMHPRCVARLYNIADLIAVA